MEILNNITLKPYNSFGIDVSAKHFITVRSTDEIREFIGSGYAKERFLVLGGGSNLLFTNDFNGSILKIDTKGISVISENDDEVLIKVAAGDVWDELVAYCVDKGWGGLENLSGIPGNVGASPIQNIGAYGVELKDHFIELEAMDIESGEIIKFTSSECKFSYRNSIFKEKARGQYIILSLTFSLKKHAHLALSYGDLEKEAGENPTIKSVRSAVLKIRKSKLPDPEELGNAGSFFKNPVITYKHYVQLKEQYPDLVAYEQAGRIYKVAAGWMIDKLGFKGQRQGDAGVHEKQALVLVNYGNAKGKDILNLAKSIQVSVKQHFGIVLEPEVNVV